MSRDSENEKKKQEEALRRFRMRESNILVSSSVLGTYTVLHPEKSEIRKQLEIASNLFPNN